MAGNVWVSIQETNSFTGRSVLALPNLLKFLCLVMRYIYVSVVLIDCLTAHMHMQSNCASI